MTVSACVISAVHASSLKYLPHTVQCQYSMLPSAVQVAAVAAICSIVCATFAVTVSACVISAVHASSLKYLPHTVQCQYSILPSAVQVAAVAATCSRVCATFAVTVSACVISVVPAASEKYLPHTVQCQYSILPSSVQVADTASTCSRVCATMGISAFLVCVVNSSLLNVAVYIPEPTAVQVAFCVTL